MLQHFMWLIGAISLFRIDTVESLFFTTTFADLFHFTLHEVDIIMRSFIVDDNETLLNMCKLLESPMKAFQTKFDEIVEKGERLEQYKKLFGRKTLYPCMFSAVKLSNNRSLAEYFILQSESINHCNLYQKLNSTDIWMIARLFKMFNGDERKALLSKLGSKEQMCQLESTGWMQALQLLSDFDPLEMIRIFGSYLDYSLFSHLIVANHNIPIESVFIAYFLHEENISQLQLIVRTFSLLMTIPESTKKDVLALHLKYGITLDERCATYLSKLMSKEYGVVFDYLIDLSDSLSLNHASLLLALLDRTCVQVKIEKLFLLLEKVEPNIISPQTFKLTNLILDEAIWYKIYSRGLQNKLPRQTWPLQPIYRTLDDRKYQYITTRFGYLPFSDRKLPTTKKIKASLIDGSFPLKTCRFSRAFRMIDGSSTDSCVFFAIDQVRRAICIPHQERLDEDLAAVPSETLLANALAYFLITEEKINQFLGEYHCSLIVISQLIEKIVKSIKPQYFSHKELLSLLVKDD